MSEAKINNSDNEFLDQIGGGFARLDDNPALEAGVYAYQTRAREQHYRTEGDVFTVHDLEPVAMRGLTTIHDTLVGLGIPQDVLASRLNRLTIRIRTPEESQSVSSDVGGEYDSHTATVVLQPINGESGERHTHYTLHELIHGMMQSQGVFEHNGRVIVTGNGLDVARAHNGDKFPEHLTRRLVDLNEGIVETMNLQNGITDVREYLQVGYILYTPIVNEIMAADPEVVHELVRVAFVSGIHSRTHAEALASKLA